VVNVDAWNGRVVIANPKIVPVFFANDDATVVGELATFEDELGSSSYWATVAAEYGVGVSTREAPVMSSDTPSGRVTDAQITAWIQTNVNSGVLPPPDPSAMYVLHYPTAVTSGDASCSYNLGYHSDAVLTSGDDVLYIVLPRCPNASFSNDPDGVLTTTDTFTHELAELSTDPFGDTYAQVDTAHSFWGLLTGGSTEIGDMCEWDTGVTPGCDVQIAEFTGYGVQRIWSNVAAYGGRDPCEPEMPGEIFVNAPPELPDTVSVGDGYGDTIQILAISVPVNQSKTIPLDLYSEAPTGGPFQVQVQGFNAWSGSGSDPFTVSQDKTTGQNGDRIMLTITRQSAANEGGCGSGFPCYDVFVIMSTLGGNTFTTFGAVSD
jgi:hypothetical protein